MFVADMGAPNERKCKKKEKYGNEIKTVSFHTKSMGKEAVNYVKNGRETA